MQNETKVGLLVVVALAGLGWMSVKSGALGTSLATPMREIGSTFANVEGIEAGSPVKMAGVVVGEVDRVNLRPDGRADVYLKVRKDVPLAADVGAEITNSGLIGERFVQLTSSGTAGAEGTMLPEDASVIPSFGGGSGTGDIAGNFGQVSEDLEAITSTLRKVLGNEANAEKIQTIIDGFSNFASGMEGSGDTIQKFGVMADNFALISERLKNGEGPLGQLLMGNNTSGTLGGFGDLSAAMADLRQVMAKINSGQGTLGKLVNDPATAEKLDNALDTFSAVSDRVDQLRTEIAFEGYSLNAEHGVGKGGAMLTLAPRPTRFYQLGVSSDGFAGRSKDIGDPGNDYYRKDFGEETAITAQLGQVYQDVLGTGQDVAVRVGLKNSTAGVGADTTFPMPFQQGKNIKLSADAYDFGGNNTPNSNSPHVDVTARMDMIGNTVYGVAGYDNVLNSEYGSPFFGLGMRFQDDDLKYLVGKAL